MSNARNLADIISGAFDVPAGALDNVEGLPDAIDVNASAPADSLAIDASGNIGVGTTSPNQKLTINSGALAFAGNTSTPTTSAGIHRPATDTLALITNSAEAMRIDSAGRVTMPYQPSFYAYASNSYSATTTNELVKFNATSFDTGNNFDISAGNHKFVAPVSGVYSFQSTINTYSVGVGSILRTDLYVNGSAVSRGDYMISDHTGDQNVSISVTRSLSANDYVQIYHISDDTSRGFSGNGTWVWFSGFLVG